MAEEGSQETHNMRKSTKIVIIGAGIAGIAAGNLLAEAGLTDFVILEATNRIGGRIHSIDLATANGSKAELGANWIHGIDRNPIFKICQEHDLLAHSYQGRKLGQKVMFLMEDGRPMNTRVVEDIDWSYGMFMAQCEDFYQDHTPPPSESVGGFINIMMEEKLSRYNGRERQFREMILAQRMLGECIITGCHSMHDVALSEVGSFEELPGIHYVIPPGFESVVHILNKAVPQDSLLLNHVVTQINWAQNQGGTDDSGLGPRDNSQQVCVQCQNGTRIYADHVLVTIPLGYLKKHAGRLFTPPLPENKTTSIDRVGMGTVNKIILEFGGQILPDEVFRLEMVWDRSNVENEDVSTNWVKKIVSFELVAPTVLIGWLCGREAEYMETLSDEEVEQTVISALKRFLKNSRPSIPPLKKFTRSHWHSEPYSLGAYCYLPVGAYAEDIETIAEPVHDANDKPVLLFAGEATHPTFYSSSHGALLSGQREAQRLLEFVH